MELTTLVGALSTVASIYNTGATLYNLRNPNNKLSRVNMPNNNELVHTNGNIIKLIKHLIVEPNIIVSRSAYDSKVLDNVNGLVLDIFTSFYIQAFHILTKLYKKSELQTIELLSTKRNKINLKTILGGYANLKSDMKVLKDTGSTIATAINTLSVLNDIDLNNGNIFLNKEDIESLNLEKTLNDSLFVDLKENIAGTLIRDFVLTVNGIIENPVVDRNGVPQLDANGDPILESVNKATQVPIMVKATVVVALTESLLAVLDNKGYKTSLMYRWMEYKSGGISLSDFIFCSDLIREYKKTKLSNYTDVLNKIETNSMSANIQGYLKNVKGFEASYNMIVLTQDDVYTLNKLIKAKGGLESYNGMQEFMEAMGAHSVTILNDDTERAKIYISELNGNMDIGYNRLFKRKDSDNNVMDMFKAIISNTIPRF